MEEIKWGILGCAGIAESAVIPAILKARNSILYALSSRDIKKAKDFADRFNGQKYYGSYQELLEDSEVDAIYIPLPNSLHKEWTIQAIKKGKHVLCEKPLALNQEEAIEMIEAAEKNRVLLMEAFMYRFHPLVKKIKETIEEGLLGDIKYISANFCFYSSRPSNDIRFKKELGGGALNDIGCYPVNAARYFVGAEPVEVYNTFIERKDTNVDNQGLGILKFENGILASINYSMGFYDKKDVEIVGTKGKVIAPQFFEWTGADDKHFYIERNGERKKIIVEGREQYVLEIEEFAQAILEGKPAPLDPGKDALNNLKVMDAMKKSDLVGQSVKLF